MNKCEIAKEFDVSRATVHDWIRRGCPVGADGNMDPAAVAGWKARRDLARLGAEDEPAFADLPDLMAELTRREVNLGQRIDAVNRWPAGMTAAPGVVKAAVVSSLILEQALLNLPGKIISDPTAETLPARLLRAVLGALDEAKSEPPASSPAPAGTRRVAASPVKGPRRGKVKNERGLTQ